MRGLGSRPKLKSACADSKAGQQSPAAAPARPPCGDSPGNTADMSKKETLEPNPTELREEKLRALRGGRLRSNPNERRLGIIYDPDAVTSPSGEPLAVF